MCWPPGGKRWKVSRVRGQQYQSHFPIGQKNEHPAVFLIKMTFSLILPLASLHNIINHFCTILTNRFFFFTFCTVFVFDWCIDALVIIIIIMVAFWVEVRRNLQRLHLPASATSSSAYQSVFVCFSSSSSSFNSRCESGCLQLGKISHSLNWSSEAPTLNQIYRAFVSM